jgi:hypothetical protein
MKLETIKVRQEGAVLFAEISSPPMNLLGPELVRDLVSLIQWRSLTRRSRYSSSKAPTTTISFLTSI